MVGPLRTLPTQGPCHFSPFIEEKNVFLLSGRGGGVTPPYTLSGLTIKKNTFLCVSTLSLYETFFVNPVSVTIGKKIRENIVMTFNTVLINS